MVSDGTAVPSESVDLPIVSAGVSNKGIKREINEDAFSILEKTGYQVFLVADGLGGPKRGAVASNLALSSIRIALKEFSTFDTPSILRDAVVRANKDVFEKASASKTLHGMGTTITGLVVAGNKIVTVNVGNSRIYKFSGGNVSRLTVDHTVVEELRREGVEPSKDLDLRPKSHLLTRSLGVKPNLDVDVESQPDQLQPGDVFLLCTDGLHDLVDDEEMAGIISAHALKEAAHLLINLANERGGHDNITVVLLQAGERQVSASVAVKPKELSEAVEEKTPAERGMRRLAPLKGRVREERPGAKAPTRVSRQGVPGRELLDLRERDDAGEMVAVKPARVGRKRLKPPAPAAASSGGRGAQRLSASPALGKAPLSRRLPPLTQRIEERKERDVAVSVPVAISKGKQVAADGKVAPSGNNTSGRMAEKVSIELNPQAVSQGKTLGRTTAASTKPQLLSSPPASSVRVSAPVVFGLGFGLLLVGGVFALRFISTSPAGGGLGKESVQRSRPTDVWVGGNDTGIDRQSEGVGAVSNTFSDGGSTKERSFVGGADLEEILTVERTRPGAETVGYPNEPRVDRDAFREVKEQSVARIRDTMLRTMLLDVIDAIEQAVHSAEVVVKQLEQGEAEMTERLKKMADISEEAVTKLTKDVKGVESPTAGSGKKAMRPADAMAKDRQATSLAEKKRRLIEGLPDVDPFAKD